MCHFREALEESQKENAEKDARISQLEASLQEKEGEVATLKKRERLEPSMRINSKSEFARIFWHGKRVFCTFLLKGPDGNEAKALRDGELRAISPEMVHVREKAVQGRVSFCTWACFDWWMCAGMIGHLGPDGRYLPLLPRGDPNKPRAKARFSVLDMPEGDVRKGRVIEQHQGRMMSEI